MSKYLLKITVCSSVFSVFFYYYLLIVFNPQKKLFERVTYISQMVQRS